MVLVLLVIWIVVAIVAAIIASNKGRSNVGWFFLCLLLTPLAILVLLALPEAEGAIKTCPQCAETVKAEAKICRFCHYEFPPNQRIAHDPNRAAKAVMRFLRERPAEGEGKAYVRLKIARIIFLGVAFTLFALYVLNWVQTLAPDHR